jgi:hypothetical protein
MKFRNITLFLLSIVSLHAKAEIICKVQTVMGLAVVQIDNSSITISGAALEKPVIYDNLSYSYDGHMTGIITAPGISVSYQNWYGCIHNATVTANFRSGNPGFIQTTHVAQCSGGSTPDSVCHVQ